MSDIDKKIKVMYIIGGDKELDAQTELKVPEKENDDGIFTIPELVTLQFALGHMLQTYEQWLVLFTNDVVATPLVRMQTAAVSALHSRLTQIIQDIHGKETSG